MNEPLLTRHCKSSPTVAVLIATCNRPGLLAQRSLTSVQRQNRHPDFLVVVDDSDPKLRPDNRNIINDVRLTGTRIIYLPNTRHRGASGAWNTGLEWLRRLAGDASGVFVAVLDDDDEWETDHLAICLEAVCTRNLDMVAPAIARITTNETRTQAPPANLDPDLFLVGNPHIQGSNLFVRLSAVLEAGAFDESLTSSTDRDLCIRLADLGWVRYSPIARSTVRHHAETDRPRLTSPENDQKKQGLDRFWVKWNGRMTDEQKDACCQRAKALFGWSPLTPQTPVESLPGPYVPARTQTEDEKKHADDLVLVVGVITDPDHAGQFRRLLDQLVTLQRFDHICSLDVVILHNGGPVNALETIVADYRARGLVLFLATEKQQVQDAQRNMFGTGFTRPEGRSPIGPARTMLQSYVTRVANQRPGAIAWVLDDDSNLENVCDGQASPLFHTLLSSLKKMQSLGVDAVLGTVTGDPPVPPGSSVRTQLVDLYHNLGWLLRSNPETPLPDRSADNRASRVAAKDFYYDLSRRDTHHLEWPFWLTPSQPGERVGDALARMIAFLPRILAGQAKFRPLVLDPSHDAVASMRPSVQRGTNTFVFNLDAFRHFPNAAPHFAGSTLRRSDMIWSLLNRYTGGRRIVSATLPVRHDRSDDAAVGLDLERLIPDIRGYALYSAIEDVLVRRRQRRLHDGVGAEIPDNLSFKGGDCDYAVRRFQKYLVERTAALMLSCWRIQGLCKAIARLSAMPNLNQLLRGDARYHESVETLRLFLDETRSYFAPDLVQSVIEEIRDVPGDQVRDFLQSLGGIVENHRKAALILPCDDDWFHGERQASALSLAQKLAGIQIIRLLGSGGEGVVFESADTVIKVIDYAKYSPANGARQGLAKLAASDSQLTALYRPALPEIADGRLIICYPFEPSEPYRGGHSCGIIQILRDCRSAGIIMTNLHPKNLCVTSAGVRLIDYGSDIRLFTKEGFESMTQRAWLTLHHHERSDLSDLMRRALTENQMPELEGWESLLAAIDAPSKREVIDDALMDILRPLKPRKVLDFGCGHGRLAMTLAVEGAEVTGFDPDQALHARWEQFCANQALPVRWLSGDAQDALREHAESFDMVVCSLVLCVIEAELGYIAALQSISGSLCSGGRFVLVVCNPDTTFGEDSTMQQRVLPADANTSNTFRWTKYLPSGSQRSDVHRPLSKIVSDLARVGLIINSVTSAGGLGINTLLPSRDFLILAGTKFQGTHTPAAIWKQCRRVVMGRRPDNLPVVCYHRVLPKDWNDAVSDCQRIRGTVVDLAVFTRQLDDLRRLFYPVNLAQYTAWLDGESELPPNACLVTFDDGYRDFLDFALPELAKHKIPCALFATMSSAKGEELLPADSLYSALSVAKRDSHLNDSEIREWVTGEEKQRFIRANFNEQRRILDDAGLHPVKMSPSNLYLNETELARLPVELVELGGHGCRHELLANRELYQVRAELRKVRFWLEGLNPARGCLNLSLAYPNGKHDSIAIAAAIEAGFTSAFSVEPWRKGPASHRWRINRSCIPNQSEAIKNLASGKEIHI